jgi:hypothetical protein
LLRTMLQVERPDRLGATFTCPSPIRFATSCELKPPSASEGGSIVRAVETTSRPAAPPASVAAGGLPGDPIPPGDPMSNDEVRGRAQHESRSYRSAAPLSAAVYQPD